MPISELFDMAASPVRKLLNTYNFENGGREIIDLETTTSTTTKRQAKLYILSTLNSLFKIISWEDIILGTVQDFLIKLGIKSCKNASIGYRHFFTNHVTVRPTKIMSRADKNWAHF